MWSSKHWSSDGVVLLCDQEKKTKTAGVMITSILTNPLIMITVTIILIVVLYVRVEQ